VRVVQLSHTDEFGCSAVENRVHVHDMNATILYLMGVSEWNGELHLWMRWGWGCALVWGEFISDCDCRATGYWGDCLSGGRDGGGGDAERLAGSGDGGFSGWVLFISGRVVAWVVVMGDAFALLVVASVA
jgi:hypothetical protein